MSEHVEIQQATDKIIWGCLSAGTAADWFGFVENHIPFILMCVAILGLVVKFYYARLDAKYKLEAEKRERAAELREVEKHKHETLLAKAQIEAVKNENERLDIYSKVMLKKVEKEND